MSAETLKLGEEKRVDEQITYRLLEEKKNLSSVYQEFETMNLDQKFERFNELFPDYNNWERKYFNEIKMSNDGLFLFACENHIGMPQWLVRFSSGKIDKEIVQENQV